MPLPSAGGGQFHRGPMVVKLLLHGHANRPFFHIAITSKFGPRGAHPVEQLGTYDPMPNADNQKLLSLNTERTRFWMGQGAVFSRSAAKLLGRAGFLPVQPNDYVVAWRYRYKGAADAVAKKNSEVGADGTTQPPSSSS